MANGVRGVGFVGCGRSTAELHLPALKTVAGFKVEAVCDTDALRLEEVASRFGIDRAYTDLGGLLDDKSVDLVAVCVPASRRLSILDRVLDGDQALFIEKPLALQVEEGRRIDEAASTGGRPIFVGHNLRCHRLAEACRRILLSGDLGAIELVSTVWSTDFTSSGSMPEWRRSLSSGGGVVYEMAIHHLDLVEWLLGDRFATVWSTEQSRSSELSSAVISGATDQGTLVTSLFSQESVPRNSFEICGSKGRLELDLYRFDGLRVYGASDSLRGLSSRIKAIPAVLAQLPRGLAIAVRGGDYRLSYQRQWQRILSALDNSGKPPCSTFDGLRAVQLASAAIEAIAGGSTVSVPLDTLTTGIRDRVNRRVE